MAYIPSCPEEEAFLKAYDATKYPLPAVTVDMALFAFDGEALSVLLIRRGNYPFKGALAFPGGFLNMDESPETAAARELLEETGVSGILPRQIYVLGAPERDPRHRILSVLHLALVDKNAIRPKAGDDAAEAAYYTLTSFDEDRSTVSCGFKGDDLSFTLSAQKLPAGQLQMSPGPLSGDHNEGLLRSVVTLRDLLRQSDLALSYSPHPSAEKLSALFDAAYLPQEEWKNNPYLNGEAQ